MTLRTFINSKDFQEILKIKPTDSIALFQSHTFESKTASISKPPDILDVIINLSAFSNVFQETRPYFYTGTATFHLDSPLAPFETIKIIDAPNLRAFGVKRVTTDVTYLYREFYDIPSFNNIETFVKSITGSTVVGLMSLSAKTVPMIYLEAF
jgi:hypothetical protein